MFPVDFCLDPCPSGTRESELPSDTNRTRLFRPRRQKITQRGREKSTEEGRRACRHPQKYFPAIECRFVPPPISPSPSTLLHDVFPSFFSE